MSTHCPSCGAPYFMRESACSYCHTVRAGFKAEARKERLEYPPTEEEPRLWLACVGSVVGAYLGCPTLGYAIGRRL